MWSKRYYNLVGERIRNEIVLWCVKFKTDNPSFDVAKFLDYVANEDDTRRSMMEVIRKEAELFEKLRKEVD